MRRHLFATLLILGSSPSHAAPDACMAQAAPLCLLEAADTQAASLIDLPPDYYTLRTNLLESLAERAAEGGDREGAFILLLRASGVERERYDAMLSSLALSCVEAGELELFGDISWELSSDEVRMDILESALRQLTSRRPPADIDSERLSLFFNRAEYPLRRYHQGGNLRQWLKRLARGYERIGEQEHAQRLYSEVSGDEPDSSGEAALERGDFLGMMTQREWSERPQKRAKQQLDALESWQRRWPQRDAASMALGQQSVGGLSASYIDLGLRIHQTRAEAELDPLGAQQRLGLVVESLQQLPDSPERDHWLFGSVKNLLRMNALAWDEAAQWSASINDRIVRLEAAAAVMEEAAKAGGEGVLPAVTTHFDDPIIALLAEYERGERLRKDEREAEALEHYRRAMYMGMRLEDDVDVDGHSLQVMLMMEVMGRARRLKDISLAREAGSWLENHIARYESEASTITLNLLDEYRRIGAESDAQRLQLALKDQLQSLDEAQFRQVLNNLFNDALQDHNWAEAESLIHQAKTPAHQHYMGFELAKRQLEQGGEAYRESAVNRLMEIADVDERQRNSAFMIIRKKGGATAMEGLLELHWVTNTQRDSLREELLTAYIEAGELKPMRRLLARMSTQEAVDQLIAQLYKAVESRPDLSDVLWAELLRRVRHDDAESLTRLSLVMHHTPPLLARYGEKYQALLAQVSAGLKLRLRSVALSGGPAPGQTEDEWNEAWRELLREGDSLVMGERLLLWLAVAQAQLTTAP